MTALDCLALELRTPGLAHNPHDGLRHRRRRPSAPRPRCRTIHRRLAQHPQHHTPAQHPDGNDLRHHDGDDPQRHAPAQPEHTDGVAPSRVAPPSVPRPRPPTHRQHRTVRPEEVATGAMKGSDRWNEGSDRWSTESSDRGNGARGE